MHKPWFEPASVMAGGGTRLAIPLTALVGAVLLVMLLTDARPAGGEPTDGRRWVAGGYAFSDERGGFRIVSVSGTGTRPDPIVISQTFTSTGPATLVIRAAKPIPGRLMTYADANFATGFIHMRIVATNDSGLAWREFAFALEEVAGRASGYYDGLSFDQNGLSPRFASSDRFARIEIEHEGADLLRFRRGHVDPGAHATFDFHITDITPVGEFYLVEDPRIPIS